MHFDASTVFVLVLSAAVVVIIALINVYGRDTTSAPSTQGAAEAPVLATRQSSKSRPKQARKR